MDDKTSNDETTTATPHLWEVEHPYRCEDSNYPIPAKPCGCPEPDGYCDACEDEHGHTCIVCGYDFCGLCWETSAHNDDCKREAPSLTTEQARALATRWSEHRAWEGSWSRPPEPEPDELTDPEREQLFAWVRARLAVLAPTRPDRVELSYYIALDLDLPMESTTPAMALCEAAGWPS